MTDYLLVRSFLDPIEHMQEFRKLDDLLDTVSPLYGINLSDRISSSEFGRIKRSYENDLAVEITRRHAKWMTNRFFSSIRRQPQTKRSLIHALNSVLKRSAVVHTPMMGAFVKSILSWARRESIQNVFFLARDCLPLFSVAKALAPRSFSSRMKILELNRDMLSIPDEIARAVLKKQERGKRLEQQVARAAVYAILSNLFRRHKSACVDTGCYGSIVREIYRNLREEKRPLFFFYNSVNPHIWGFLNHVIHFRNIEGEAVPFDLVWTVGDSIEAIPKPYQDAALMFSSKAETIVGRQSYQVMCRPKSWAFGLSAFTAYFSFFQHAKMLDIGSIDPLQEIDRLYLSMKKQKAGITKAPVFLPTHMPDWSQASKFLAEFGQDAIPPQPALL